MRPSEAPVWARPQADGGCLGLVTLPPARESQETEATRRGTRLHEEMAARLSPIREKAGNDPLTLAETALCDVAESIARQAIAEWFPAAANSTPCWQVELPLSVSLPMGGSDRAEQVIEGTSDLVVSGEVDRVLVGGVKPVRTPRLLILDYKFGSLPVEADRNPQLQLYALMAMMSRSVPHLDGPFRGYTEVAAGIIQPALTPVLRIARASYRALMDFRLGLMSRLQWIAMAPDHRVRQAFAPGESNCRWCRGRVDGTCDAFRRHQRQAAASHYRSLQATED